MFAGHRTWHRGDRRRPSEGRTLVFNRTSSHRTVRRQCARIQHHQNQHQTSVGRRQCFSGSWLVLCMYFQKIRILIGFSSSSIVDGQYRHQTLSSLVGSSIQVFMNFQSWYSNTTDVINYVCDVTLQVFAHLHARTWWFEAFSWTQWATFREELRAGGQLLLSRDQKCGWPWPVCRSFPPGRLVTGYLNI